MAIQLQLRRGTSAENNVFTGAAGELTMDTDTNGLRIHDGTTIGGFAVPVLVAVQRPTADNNYTWYRKWSDGWVEQGGRNSVTGYGTTSNSNITLPVEMASDSYDVIATINGAGENVAVGCSVYKLSTKAISLRINYNSSLTRTLSWRVCGMAAS